VSDLALQYWNLDGEKMVHSLTGESLTARHKRLLQDLADDAMPARPRGDAKERTFNLLIRDGIDPRGNESEAKLIGEAPDDEKRAFSTAQEIPEEYRPLFGDILDDHYVVEAKGGVRFLFPFQSLLPGAFKFYGQYKMFNGKVLAFLSQPTAASSPEFNSELIDRFYALFNGETGLSLLDNTVLKIAQKEAAVENSFARADVLLSRHYGEPPQAPGALVPSAHHRFQSDLDSVLAIRSLNRRDLVGYAVNIFYLHLALYFQRLAWLLEEEFRLVLEALNDPTVPLDRAFACFSSGWSDSPFAGSLRFRVATGQPLPISVTDGCLLSYREQTRRQLLLPANLSVLAAARNVMIACGQDAARWSFANIANACRADSSLAAAFDEGMSYMAMATVADRQLEDREDIMRQVESSSPGIEVFREALLKTNRSALRRSGRDIVHALVHRGGRGYISSRGTNLYFFEIGQDLLLLLAKVIVGDTHMPFRRFLEELRRYGFAPQNRTEEDRLADTLRVLNLLEKHSDAGEAMYVKHFL
jgi:hypothetical protein